MRVRVTFRKVPHEKELYFTGAGKNSYLTIQGKTVAICVNWGPDKFYWYNRDQRLPSYNSLWYNKKFLSLGECKQDAKQMIKAWFKEQN